MVVLNFRVPGQSVTVTDWYKQGVYTDNERIDLAVWREQYVLDLADLAAGWVVSRCGGCRVATPYTDYRQPKSIEARHPRENKMIVVFLFAVILAYDTLYPTFPPTR
jgi:hypothetical protein